MKTIEQAANEYFEEYGYNKRSGEDLAFKAGVEFAQRWIPVEEESPAVHDYVLAKSSVGDVYVANYSRNKYHVNMPFEVKITHWRPIEYK